MQQPSDIFRLEYIQKKKILSKTLASHFSRCFKNVSAWIFKHFEHITNCDTRSCILYKLRKGYFIYKEHDLVWKLIFNFFMTSSDYIIEYFAIMQTFHFLIMNPKIQKRNKNKSSSSFTNFEIFRTH